MHRVSVIKFAGGLDAVRRCDGGVFVALTLLLAQGHEVRLMSPEYVRPYVKAQKNDDRDAEAIAEAATRPTMRFVELKTEEQLDMQTLHRVREHRNGRVCAARQSG
jgi:transposase